MNTTKLLFAVCLIVLVVYPTITTASTTIVAAQLPYKASQVFFYNNQLYGIVDVNNANTTGLAPIIYKIVDGAFQGNGLVLPSACKMALCVVSVLSLNLQGSDLYLLTSVDTYTTNHTSVFVHVDMSSFQVKNVESIAMWVSYTTIIPADNISMYGISKRWGVDTIKISAIYLDSLFGSDPITLPDIPAVYSGFTDINAYNYVYLCGWDVNENLKYFLLDFTSDKNFTVVDSYDINGCSDMSQMVSGSPVLVALYDDYTSSAIVSMIAVKYGLTEMGNITIKGGQPTGLAVGSTYAFVATSSRINPKQTLLYQVDVSKKSPTLVGTPYSVPAPYMIDYYHVSGQGTAVSDTSGQVAFVLTAQNYTGAGAFFVVNFTPN